MESSSPQPQDTGAVQLTHLRFGLKSLGIMFDNVEILLVQLLRYTVLQSTFRVLKFRGWFRVCFFWCTLKSILHSTFRVPNFRDWFGVARQTKEPGRKHTYINIIYIYIHITYMLYNSRSQVFRHASIQYVFTSLNQHLQQDQRYCKGHKTISAHPSCATSFTQKNLLHGLDGTQVTSDIYNDIGKGWPHRVSSLEADPRIHIHITTIWPKRIENNRTQK